MTPFNLRILIVFLALTFSQSAGAWGHTVHLNSVWSKSLLVNPVIRNRQIKYCIDIQNNRFDEASIKIQTEAALKLWLEALVPMKIASVALTEVECLDGAFNLKIEIGDESSYPEKGSYHALESKGEHYYSLVKINSDFAVASEGKINRSDDFMKFAGGNLKGLRTLVQSVSFEKRKTVYEFAQQEGVDWKEIFETSYVSLIHEMGHAFGLCDTAEESPKCDPKFMSKAQPTSVMRDATFFYLTTDDVEGVRSVFKRVLSAAQPPVVAKNPLAITEFLNIQ